jgi:hypothetical protein
VKFPNDSTTPVGIFKWVTNDSFAIQNTGVYLIFWTVNAQTSGLQFPSEELALFLTVNGSPIMSTPVGLYTFTEFTNPFFKAHLSGRTTLVLQAGDVVSLEALASIDVGEVMQINSALIDIIQIPSQL